MKLQGSSISRGDTLNSKSSYGQDYLESRLLNGLPFALRTIPSQLL
jgi:hypothetical protein